MSARRSTCSMIARAIAVTIVAVFGSAVGGIAGAALFVWVFG